MLFRLASNLRPALLAVTCALALVACSQTETPQEIHVQAQNSIVEAQSLRRINFNPMQTLQNSHNDGHLPTASTFDLNLSRDVTAYFANLLDQNVSVEITLLRKDPTQVGAAFPKYYAWVSVTDANNEVKAQGSLRIAAKNKTRFAVTHFVSKDVMIKDPESLNAMLPKSLIPTAMKYAQGA